MNICSEIIKRYLNWLGDQFQVTDSAHGNGCIINTPFQDNTGKFIEIEIYSNNENNIIISDRGETFDSLFLQGINIHTPKRKNIIENILNDYNATVQNGEIWLNSNFENLSATIQNIVHIINNIAYLTYSASISPAGSFRELVLGYFVENKVSIIPDYSIRGEASDHSFDFCYQKDFPIVFRAMSTKSPFYAKTLAALFAYSITDIKRAGIRLNAHPFIDDRDEEESIWEGEPKSILRVYSDEIIYWSNKERALELIAA